MPEQDKEVSRSSDAFVEGQVEVARNAVFGLNQEVIEIKSADVKTPASYNERVEVSNQGEIKIDLTEILPRVKIGENLLDLLLPEPEDTSPLSITTTREAKRKIMRAREEKKAA